jgi:transposase
MLNFTGSLRVFLGAEPVDLHKSFNGLLPVVPERLKEDPWKGALFVFSNRSHSRLKMLSWDGPGLWVLAERLKEGTFARPLPAEAGAVKSQLSPAALSLFMNGVDLRGARFRTSYER